MDTGFWAGLLAWLFGQERELTKDSIHIKWDFYFRERNKMASLSKQRVFRENSPKKVYIRTFGCQMNDADSKVMERLLEREGIGR